MEKTDTKHVRFYYLRDLHNNLFGCVCTIRTDNNKFHRGISLCNFAKGDKFSKKIGRNISYSRALKIFQIPTLDMPMYHILGLSDQLSNKIQYCSDIYGLAHSTENGFLYLNGIEGNVDLTSSEKNMWKDILDPSFASKPTNG